MSNIIYHGGSLFQAPKENTIFVHSVNCRCNWGAGIALMFRELYPEAYKHYQSACREDYPEHLIGTALQWHKPNYQSVGSLFTSKHYNQIDTQYNILLNTKRALTMLLNNLPEGFEVHAPKINSGLFRVPWEKTERVIETVLADWTPKKTLHIWEGGKGNE